MASDKMFKKVFLQVMGKNEAGGDSAYKLTFARDGSEGNKSGYTFGPLQWDLHAKLNALGKGQREENPIYKIMKEAVDAVDDKVWNDIVQEGCKNPEWKEVAEKNGTTKEAVIDALISAIGSSDPFVAPFIDTINTCLSKKASDIDTLTDVCVDEYSNIVSNFISGQGGYIQPGENVKNYFKNPSTSLLASVFLLDYHNRFNFAQKGKMNCFLAGQEVEGNDKGEKLKISEVFGIDDMLTLYFNTKESKKGSLLMAKRFLNIIKVFEENGIEISFSARERDYFGDRLQAIVGKTVYEKLKPIIAELKVFQDGQDEDEKSFWEILGEIAAEILNPRKLNKLELECEGASATMLLPSNWECRQKFLVKPNNFMATISGKGKYGGYISSDIVYISNPSCTAEQDINNQIANVKSKGGYDVCTLMLDGFYGLWMQKKLEEADKTIKGNAYFAKDNVWTSFFYEVNNNYFSLEALDMLYQIYSIISGIKFGKDKEAKDKNFNLELARVAYEVASAREKEVIHAFEGTLTKLKQKLQEVSKPAGLDAKAAEVVKLIEAKTEGIDAVVLQLRKEVEKQLSSRDSTFGESRKKLKALIRSIKSAVSKLPAETRNKFLDITASLDVMYDLCSGRCYRYFKVALAKAGIDISLLKNDISACNAKDKLGLMSGKNAFGEICFKKLDDIFEEPQLDAGLAYFEYFRDIAEEPSKLRKLPPGMIVVWDSDKDNKYGHVSITLENGYEASDMIIRQMTDYSGGFTVFIPLVK